MNNMILGLLDPCRSRNYLRGLFLVILIFTSHTIVISLQQNTTNNRSIIIDKFLRRQQQYDKSSTLISCIVTFINEYFDYPNRILFLLPDLLRDIPDLVKSLVSELHASSAVVMYLLNGRNTMNATLRIYEGTSVSIAILSETAITVDTSELGFKNICKRHCNFLIILTELYNDKKIFLTSAETLIQRIWSRSILKLTILASVRDTVLFVSTNFFTRTSKLPVSTSEPMLLGRCNEKVTKTRRQWRSFMDKINCRTSDGCSVVNAAMFDNFPFTLMVNDTDTDQYRFSGIEGSMIEEIARSIKVRLNRGTIVWTNETVIKDEVELRLSNETHYDDIIFGGLLWDPTEAVEYTTPYHIVDIKWIVPIKTHISLYGLITPFRASVWYAVVCAIIMGGTVKLLFFNDISFLDIAALMFGVATHQPLKVSSRIKFISWALFSFFLAQFYLGSLADQLINASNVHIETMEELALSGLKIGGTEQLTSILEDFGEDYVVEQTIQKNLIVLEEDIYNKYVQDLIEGRNTSMAFILNISSHYHTSDVGHAHIVKEALGNYPLAFATWRGFPYLDSINLKIQTFVQIGLVEHWRNMMESSKNNYSMDVNSQSNLDLTDLIPAFLVLFIGYSVACCLLILEIIFHSYQISSCKFAR